MSQLAPDFRSLEPGSLWPSAGWREQRPGGLWAPGFSADLGVEAQTRQSILELVAAFTTEPIMPESHHYDFRTVL